ncbi:MULTISPECIES: hypothetical protein [Methylorubrum]|uniref:hypothetical protein n=1 Tax=Methylorubrum TaxID=2282523 RepID=UPI00209DF60C|nr:MULTISPECIES: hypothetical protein [Methylorubrum]MCP1550663.1 hypothetical protein [Methylorubrum zatmanii]MCP1552724.1 hypothetical protein [Methylorubrum extorquens]MCP1580966.1 hypothetical protein [Methylorubrum extorquens]
MSTDMPTPAALLGPQAVAIAAADYLLMSVGLPTYTALALRVVPMVVSELPDGVVSLDAARADRRPAGTVGRRL